MSTGTKRHLYHDSISLMYVEIAAVNESSTL